MNINSPRTFLTSEEPADWMRWIKNSSGWTPWLDSEEYCAQFRRLLCSSTASECLSVATRIKPGDGESWYREWKWLGDENKLRGNEAFARGNIHTAQSNWLRASSYFRSATCFLAASDRRRSSILSAVEKCSQLYLKHLSPKGEIVQIPCGDGSSLAGYFIRAAEAPARAPVVICLGGADGSKDEQLCRTARHALKRRLSVLLVDLPGQGSSVRRNKLKVRHDTEISIGYCVDYLLSRPDVDRKRLALYGDGLGGADASRAASLDDRFAAVVCDGGLWDQRERSFMLEWVSGVRDAGWIKEKTKMLWAHSLALRIECPCLMVLNEQDMALGEDGGLHFEDAIGLYRFCKELKPHIELKLFSDVRGPDARHPVNNPATEKEAVFDWVASKLLRRK